MVLQLLPAQVSQRLAVRGVAGQQRIAGALEDVVHPVDQPGARVRIRTGAHQMDQMPTKVGPRLAVSRPGQLSIVVCRPNPHVVHQQGEADHQAECAQRPAKLDVTRVVDLGVHAGEPAAGPGLAGKVMGEPAGSIGGVPVGRGLRGGICGAREACLDTCWSHGTCRWC